MLHHLVIGAARRTPDAVAVRAGDAALTYRELDLLANRFARALRAAGVGRGDRVGIWAEKSPRVVAAMQAVLRLGACYVPIDPAGPAARAERILRDCDARLVVSDRPDAPFDIDAASAHESAEPLPDPDVGEHDLAYLLYTSGSTGEPKGVRISHRNALAFVDWAAEELRARPDDRFGNHAPFHFDLSVLDLYVAFRAGASVHLVPRGAAYAPELLVEFLIRERLTVWYSVPSALVLMIASGALAATPPRELRAVLFAGEVFPLPHLRTLRAALPRARLLNLYGPTETNVCTFHEVTEIPADRTRPVPIGRACSGATVRVREDTGELVVSGPTVMRGYWGHPDQEGPYATGDVVVLNDDGDYEFVGRRDNQTKLRGFRIELGEVEAVLCEHDRVEAAAAVVVGTGITAQLLAFVVGRGGGAPSLLELKAHCAATLPRHMIVDLVVGVERLPLNGNGKIDRRALTARAEHLLATE
ncbi:amino acid adenylation domain-containing protein [Allokutzneria albata]|uniref:Amino acid adenylation domain-containing protein n=1 Tax=Allokutzneria albata TaxID=211114 RepID=A0A1G9U9G2_ALLAB|nr:amino acid adenylation domain-containing protein [Allokutzneria albata]SDM56579.1 amino acid adenylation domain-containing protein [Allokutzneria albata]